MFTTRLAPSPTGALHLGNARTFLVNWLLARQRHWRIVLRVEDLDGPRIKSGADRQAMEDLQWLGLDWDQGPIYQSSRSHQYATAVKSLLDAGVAYACVCSRKEVEAAASAPHAEDGSAVYPGTCRNRYASLQHAREQSGRSPAIRFAVAGGLSQSRWDAGLSTCRRG
jgi:glutamyl-tRNA synthetase